MTTTKPSVPKGKACYRAVSRDGNEMFRTSARDYTHAIEVRFTKDHYWCSPTRGDDQIHPGSWHVVSFHGSYLAAQRAAHGQWKNSANSIVDVEIIEERREKIEV